MEQLPEVAKSFSTKCTKCGEERYHRVLSHSTATSAKIQCEICGKKSTFKVGAPKAKKKAGVSKKTVVDRTEEWQKLVDAYSGPTKTYSLKEKFAPNEKVDHPKFGAGIVLTVSGNRMTLLFREGEKVLVHQVA